MGCLDLTAKLALIYWQYYSNVTQPKQNKLLESVCLCLWKIRAKSRINLEKIKNKKSRGNGREVIIYLFQGVTSHALTPGPVLIFASTLCPIADAKVFILFFSIDIESSLCAKDMKKKKKSHSSLYIQIWAFFPPHFGHLAILNKICRWDFP